MSELDIAIEKYKESATESLNTYVELTKRAAQRLAPQAAQGTKPDPNAPATPSWMDDAVTFWSTVGKDLMSISTLHQTMAAQALKK